MSLRLTVLGDTLLDRDLDGRVERLCPDAPAPVVQDISPRDRPGGAGLAAALLARDGHRVTLVTALAGDEDAATLRRLLAAEGVRVIDVGAGGATPQKARVRAGGQVLLRIDGGDEGPVIGPPDAAAREALSEADGVLVSDYGRGMAAEPWARSLLRRAEAPVVWDPHPRGPRPVRGATLVTPNASEAARLAPGDATPAERAPELARELGARAVAVTVGARGAVLGRPGEPALTIPTREVEGDPCGAGDRFASCALAGLAAGLDPVRAVAEAVARARDFVAAGGAGRALLPREDGGGESEAARVVARTRARGGRVIATGGCFDLVHAGHVSMLEAARALGDCLVVLLNSDASVRRLKGAGRPLVHEDDRATVLRALRAVDAVEVFGEDTPVEALERLRPDVFAKGGDYALAELPEHEVMRAMGGEAVVLPYVDGRSTTRLIEEATARAAD